jgi:hypothetical protein
MSDEEKVVLLYGAVGGERSRPVIVKVDGEGRLDILSNLIAVNPNDDPMQLRCDDNGLLRTRPYEPYEPITVTNIGIAWTPVVENATADSIMRVWVEIWKYTTDVVTSGVDIRFDDGVAQHEIVHNMQAMAQSPAIKLGPYHLANGWSIDMRTNVADRCRCVATIEHYGMDAL